MKNASLGILFCILLYSFLFLLLKIPVPEQEQQALPEQVTVHNTETGEITEMALEEYVWRSMAREMPAAFHTEALKAQAVAIRSYICSKTPSEAHHGALLCTDSAHCAAFLTDESALDASVIKTYKKAAKATAGQILFYDGKPANAVFHAMSSGKTENAADVWGGSVPYLVSVDSASDKAEQSYESTAEFTWEQLFTALEITEKSVGKTEHTEGGSVKTIQIGEKTFKGTEVRSYLKLRSAAFSATETGSGLYFTVHGYGHGVGMSQRGANACGNAGMDYKQILQKYYPGTILQSV